MDTLWVPRSREVPIRARRNKGVEWSLSGGEAEGAFLRELPQKHETYSKNLGDRVRSENWPCSVCPKSVSKFGHRPGASKRTHKWLQPGSQQGQASAPTNLCLFIKARAKLLGTLASLIESGNWGISLIQSGKWVGFPDCTSKWPQMLVTRD